MTPPTVFIVEDDVDTREMLAKFLELEGYSVEVAANGQEALTRLRDGVTASVILLDLMMPVMDGWEFRRRQVQDARLRNIPTVVVSAAGRDRIAQVSADAYLSKPVDMDELLQCVGDFCQRV
ncbi:MAG TPA: response regulator [Vicinamibacterales bacterium]|nr:response regulator [Vicinamibacterales bacterium]